MLPLLKQPEASLKRESLLFYYPHYSPQGGSPAAALRAGDWKLVESYEEGNVELFNLREVLGEQKNLAQQMSDKTAELTKALHARLEIYGALPAEPNPQHDPNNPLKSAYFSP